MVSGTTTPGCLTSKVAIVTGSSSGIGRAIAIRFAQEGAKVVCSDIYPFASVDIKDEADVATHEAIIKEGGRQFTSRLTLAMLKKSNYRFMRRRGDLDDWIYDMARLLTHPPKSLVNNAGICVEVDSIPLGTPCHLLPLHIFDKTMQINTRGTFLGCKYGIAQMLRQPCQLNSSSHGWIISIASVAGLVAFGGCPAYCSGKGAVVALTKQVACDY
ncbi:hypothetical protein G7Y89_g11583 [Cudoniella acicularis]|uniref:Uncharacterized protein n=1 Tax=Cudoniella acicularis TaxID=354080 RepID=A0A8H4VY61_9HELO|nr:hypothetical protein G7Y89_g11583 [Cudoniella acicularis]